MRPPAWCRGPWLLIGPHGDSCFSLAGCLSSPQGALVPMLCVQELLRAFKTRDFFGTVSPLLLPACAAAPPPPPPPVGSEGEKTAAKAEEAEDAPPPPPPLQQSLRCLQAAWEGASPATVAAHTADVATALAAAAGPLRPWAARLAALEAASALCAKAAPGGTWAAGLLVAAQAAVTDPKAAALRTAALQLLQAVCSSEAAALSDAAVAATIACVEGVARSDADSGVRGAALRCAEAISKARASAMTVDVA